MVGVKNIKFKCEEFRFKEMLHMSDIEILKKNILCKLENPMHPDGILVLKGNQKFYLIISTIKMSSTKITKDIRRKNYFAGDLKYIYMDEYWEKEEIIEDESKTKSNVLPKRNSCQQKKYDEFFKEFPISKIRAFLTDQSFHFISQKFSISSTLLKFHFISNSQLIFFQDLL